MDTEKDLLNSPEYLSWRRLHLSKSKLANVAEMSAFMSGFAVVATVELQINDGDANPALLIAFVLTTAILVATSMISMMIATCVLPHIQAVAKMEMISETPRSPHDRMIRLIDISWVLANTASLFLFTLDVILMCWIKFTWFTRTASIAATLIMGPVLIIILCFGIIFYRKIIKHQYVIYSLKYEELERMRDEIDKQQSASPSTIYQWDSTMSIYQRPSMGGESIGGSIRSVDRNSLTNDSPKGSTKSMKSLGRVFTA